MDRAAEIPVIPSRKVESPRVGPKHEQTAGALSCQLTSQRMSKDTGQQGQADSPLPSLRSVGSLYRLSGLTMQLQAALFGSDAISMRAPEIGEKH